MKRALRFAFQAALPLALIGVAYAQSFDVVSVKPSAKPVGPDYNNKITIGAAEFSGRNVTLKRLIGEAYGLQPFQIVGGPKWMGDGEYDVDAKVGHPATAGEMRPMLRPVLTERFHLASHVETRELRTYEMVVDKGGPKIHPGESTGSRPGFSHFHGELQQLANLISVQLTIPILDNPDPTKPSIASGPPIPVIDKTELTGVYDFNYEMKAEPDPFVRWQRILQEELGLRLESRKGPVQVLVVDGADRPTAN